MEEDCRVYDESFPSKKKDWLFKSDFLNSYEEEGEDHRIQPSCDRLVGNQEPPLINFPPSWEGKPFFPFGKNRIFHPLTAREIK